jgi:hypothetical protein
MYFNDKTYKTYLITLEGKHKSFLLATSKEEAEKKVIDLYVKNNKTCKKEPKIEEIPQVNDMLKEIT